MLETEKLDAIEVMKARGSVRKYERGVEIPQEELDEILTLAAKAPSSWNLQHWRYLVITSPEMKQRILPIAYNQEQVVDSSATVVILGDLEANKSAYEVYGEKLKQGQISQQVYDTMISQVEGAYKDNPQLARDEAILNASLSAMQLMLAAKAKGYDTCPMGGFDREALIKELNIPERYIPVMMITIGKAAAPARPTSRFPLSKLVIRESF
jgi:nitroreductase